MELHRTLNGALSLALGLATARNHVLCGTALDGYTVCANVQIALDLGQPMPELEDPWGFHAEDIVMNHTVWEPGAIGLYDFQEDNFRDATARIGDTNWKVTTCLFGRDDGGYEPYILLSVTRDDDDATLLSVLVSLDIAVFRQVHKQCVARQTAHYQQRLGKSFPTNPYPLSVFEDTAAALRPWPVYHPFTVPATVVHVTACPHLSATHPHLAQAIRALPRVLDLVAV